MDFMSEPFGEVISIYSDQDAINDGVLIDIASFGLTFEGKPINRMTVALFDTFEKQYPTPDGSAVDYEACARAVTAMLLFVTGEGYLRVLPKDIWMVENEIGGWTLMYPSDY